MKVLRARKLTLDQANAEPWVIVAARPTTTIAGRRDFPIVLEFYDTETGEVTPVELAE